MFHTSAKLLTLEKATDAKEKANGSQLTQQPSSAAAEVAMGWCPSRQIVNHSFRSYTFICNKVYSKRTETSFSFMPRAPSGKMISTSIFLWNWSLTENMMRRKEERKGGSVVGRIKKIWKRKIFFYCLRESGSLNVSNLFNKQMTDDKTIQVKHLSNMITCINIHICTWGSLKAFF